MVSIIIPTYKRTVTLQRAINSCLCQTYDNLEIIVVDDNDPNSVDRANAEKIMEKFKDEKKVVYLKHEKNLRGSAARNTGIKYSSGDFVTFLDDDDILEKNKIELQVKSIEAKSKDYGVVCCGVKVCDENSGKQMNIIVPSREGDVQFDILKLRMGMGTGSNPLFRRETMDKTGLFDTTFLRHQDTEYMIRVLRNYKLSVVNDILISKFESGHTNRPSVEKYIEVQNHFLKTFKIDIEKYTQEEQNEIYRNNYHQMCIVAVDARNFKVAREYYKKANIYKKYTLKMRLGILKHIINNKY